MRNPKKLVAGPYLEKNCSRGFGWTREGFAWPKVIYVQYVGDDVLLGLELFALVRLLWCNGSQCLDGNSGTCLGSVGGGRPRVPVFPLPQRATLLGVQRRARITCHPRPAVRGVQREGASDQAILQGLARYNLQGLAGENRAGLLRCISHPLANAGVLRPRGQTPTRHSA